MARPASGTWLPTRWLAALGSVFLFGLVLQGLMEAMAALQAGTLLPDQAAGEHYGRWLPFLLSVLVVSFFALAYLVPRPSGQDWRSLGLVQAFVIALYAEMYGFPLTVYLLSSFLGMPPLPGLMGPVDGHLLAMAAQRLLGVDLAGATMAVMAVSSGFMAGGFYLVFSGWRLIHGAGERLITGGIYGRLRHPQYAGIALFTFGLLVHWPTLPTVIMWPILIWTYVRLARREEQWAERTFGEAYRAYSDQVPAFVPNWRPRPITAFGEEKR